MAGDTVMESDDNQGMNVDSTSAPQEKTDLREILIILDSWNRTCDTLESALEAQVNKLDK